MQFSILKCTLHKHFIFQGSSKIHRMVHDNLVVWHTTILSCGTRHYFHFVKICHESCRVAHDTFFILKKNVMKLVVWHMTIFFCPIFVVWHTTLSCATRHCRVHFSRNLEKPLKFQVYVGNPKAPHSMS